MLRVGDRVRVTAQLIDGTTDQHIWANSYDRDVRDVLALMSDVAGAIAGEVELALTPEQQRRLRGARPLDPRAQEAYLRARHALNRLSAAGCREALSEAGQAVAIDPSFADAHAVIGGAYLVSFILGAGSVAELAPRRARPHAVRSRSTIRTAWRIRSSASSSCTWTGTGPPRGGIRSARSR